MLTGHCNLPRHKKTTDRAESSLCPKCSVEDKTPNTDEIASFTKIFDIRVKYFGIAKTVHNMEIKCNINKLATYLKEAGRLSGWLLRIFISSVHGQRETLTVGRGSVVGGGGGGGYNPHIGMSTKMQNTKSTTSLALLRLFFALEWTKKQFKAPFKA